MMPDQKNFKNNPNFFPFLLVYEKKLMFKKWIKN
jgi:hypothetical protein